MTKYLFPLILALYLALSLTQLELPGLHYDEAFEAVPALQLLLGLPVTAFRNSGLRLGGQLFPLMTQDYIGTINTYLALPFIALFGSTPTALRLMTVLVGAVTVWLAYTLARALTADHRIGLLAALLLAVDPTFIFWNRQGIFVTAVTAPIGLAAALCWWRRLRGGSPGWAMAGAFLFGLGLYAKLLFVWLIAALIGAVILLHPKRIMRLSHVIPNRMRRRNPLDQVDGDSSAKKRLRNDIGKLFSKELGGIIAAFLLGCWPLLLYNIQTGGTFLNVAQNAGTSYYGVNNLAVGANLLTRLEQFGILLAGSHLWYLGGTFTNLLAPLLFGLVLVGVVYMTTRKLRTHNTEISHVIPSRMPRKNRAGADSSAKNAFGLTWGTLFSEAESPAKTDFFNTPGRIALLPFIVIGLVILGSIATVSDLWITHFALLMPWPALALALGGWLFYRTGRRWAVWAVGLALSLLIAANLVSVIRYHQVLAHSGGLSHHSTAIYDLSDWLAEHATGPVVAMDWGLAAPVTYLTHGQIRPVEIFGYSWQADTELTDRLQKFLAQPDTLYLWRAPDEIIFDRSPSFKALYRPLHLVETIETAAYEKSGRPILGVTRLVPCGATGIQPPEPPTHCP